MAGMKRFVTYIYLYEDGKKGGNTGFAKIEIRGEECRMEIHLRGTYMNHTPCQVYLFKEDAGDILGCLTGEMNIVNGMGDFGKVMRAGRIGGSPYHMNDMEGILLVSKDNRIFLSRWTEGPAITVDMEHVRIWEPEGGKKAEPIQKNEEKIIPEKSRFAKSTYIEANSTETNRIPKQEKSTARDIAVLKEERIQADISSEAQQKENEKAQKDTMTATEIPMRNVFPRYKWEEIWETLQQSHMLLAPFEQEDAVCIKIELKDLRELPRCYWYLGNNSFLLHGFFNYRYLVLGRTEEERWFLGVPGVYQNQERVMASIFGFPEFIPEAQQKSVSTTEFPDVAAGNSYKQELQGEEPVNRFGYWFRYIEE